MKLTDIENDLMTQIFNLWEPDIDGVDSRPFRVRNYENLETLDNLQFRHILEKNSKGAYRVSFTCLLLINSNETNQLVNDLNPLYETLRNNFINEPNGATKFSDLRRLLGRDDRSFTKAIRY